jgi:hypothetical protein
MHTARRSWRPHRIARASAPRQQLVGARGCSLLPRLHRDHHWDQSHLRLDCAHRYHVCTGTALTPPMSAPGLGTCCRICTGTGLAPPTSASELGSPLVPRHQAWLSTWEVEQPRWTELCVTLERRGAQERCPETL